MKGWVGLKKEGGERKRCIVLNWMSDFKFSRGPLQEIESEKIYTKNRKANVLICFAAVPYAHVPLQDCTVHPPAIAITLHLLSRCCID